MGTYRLACASVAIHNSIYVCSISWCNIDGHYRSWIEYLTERYNVCTLDRSIEWDNTTNSDTKLHRNITLTRNTQQTKHLPVRTGTHKPIWMVKLTIFYICSIIYNNIVIQHTVNGNNSVYCSNKHKLAIFTKGSRKRIPANFHFYFNEHILIV